MNVRSTIFSRTTGALVIAALTMLTSSARAEPSDQDKELATALFNESKALLADNKVAEACRKLEESRRLDPLPGTLLNLAVCHEREGLLVSALAEFRESRALAIRDHRDDRLSLAEEHIAAIEPRISKLVIDVPALADVPGLALSRDGTALGRAAWSTQIPVDPGEHVIEASAPRKKSRRVVVSVSHPIETVTLEPLEDDAPPPPPPPPVQGNDGLAPQNPPPPPPPDDRTGLSTRRKVALAIGGAGVVALGIGTGFGIAAIEKHDDPNAKCTLPDCQRATKLNDDAKTAADVSTVSFGVAAAALAAGAVLWFTDTPRANVAAQSFVRPFPFTTAGGGGVGVAGAF